MEKLHPKAIWLFFFQPLFIGLFIPIFLGILIGRWLILVLLFYAIFCYIWAKLTYRFWYYELAENAIKIEKGVIWKKYISIPYERVQNVDIYRGIFARIFGLSELHIQTAGYSGGYGRHGIRGTEGKLPGLDVQVAEQLREELVKKVQGTKQGL